VTITDPPIPPQPPEPPKPATTFRVYYDGNGQTSGTGPVDDMAYPQGSNAIVRGEGTLLRTHFTFSGWAETANATVAAYLAGNSIVMNADKQLYAVWNEDDKYNITYYGNGHTAGAAPRDANSPYYKNSIVTVKGKGSLAKEGYTFLGWSTNSNAKRPGFVAGDTYKSTGHVQLFAVWQRNPVPVTPRPPTPTQQPTTPLPVAAPAGGGGTAPAAAIVPEAVSEPEVVPDPPAKYIPPVVPPVAPPEDFATWSLLDLLLMLIGILATLAALFFVVRRRRNDDDADSMFGYNESDSFQGNGKRKRAAWLIASSILAVISLVLFLLTQDTRMPMTWLDQWTIVFAIILILELVSIKFVFPGKGKSKNDPDGTQPA
jgi:uncharacterized repeat protein (TIGR02543 family)